MKTLPGFLSRERKEGVESKPCLEHHSRALVPKVPKMKMKGKMCGKRKEDKLRDTHF